MSANEQTGPEQIGAFRAMTGAERLKVAERLYWSALKLKTVAICDLHPDWPSNRVREEVCRIFSNART